jgi:hypothetical protein
VARDLAKRRHGVRDDHAVRQDGEQRGQHYQRDLHFHRDISTAAVRQRDKSIGIAVGVGVGVKADPSFGHVEDCGPAGDHCSGGQPELPASRCPERGGSCAGAEADAHDRSAHYSARAGAEPHPGPHGLEDIDPCVDPCQPLLPSGRSPI